MKDVYVLEDSFSKYASVKSRCVIEGNIEEPEISVFIPTYLRVDVLNETIQSVLNQKCSFRYEIVIVNNDPSGIDGPIRELIDSYEDERLYYYVNEENIGVCGNWNRGLELCRAEYVTMIHDDDVLGPWFLSSIKRVIDEGKKPTIIGVNSIVFDSNNPPMFTAPKKNRISKITKRRFFFGNSVTIAGLTVNKEKMFSIGGYSEEFYPNEDTVLIYQAILQGKVIRINEDLAGYRKEFNRSISDNLMGKVVMYTEYTRRYIAKHERFAKDWMKWFDKEYLYKYICEANAHWGIELNAKEIYRELNIPEKNHSKVKYKVMNLLLLIMKVFN